MIICGITYRKAAIYQPPNGNKSCLKTVKEAGFYFRVYGCFWLYKKKIKKQNLHTLCIKHQHKLKNIKTYFGLTAWIIITT